MFKETARVSECVPLGSKFARRQCRSPLLLFLKTVSHCEWAFIGTDLRAGKSVGAHLTDGYRNTQHVAAAVATAARRGRWLLLVIPRLLRVTCSGARPRCCPPLSVAPRRFRSPRAGHCLQMFPRSPDAESTMTVFGNHINLEDSSCPTVI